MFTLRLFYELLCYFSTCTQQGMCDDLVRALGAKSKRTLADWFAESFACNQSFSNILQPFLEAQALAGRTSLCEESKGDDRIVYLLSRKESITVTGTQNSYQFRYIEREVAPLRIAGASQPDSGAGGIDYLAINGKIPILGEIKRANDQNPFYALIQLLTYLSEIATSNQIERANQHNLFGVHIGQRPRFDLHILLADFNDRGEKGVLIEPARQLAVLFRRRLEQDHAEAATILGQILCLKLDSTHFQLPDVNNVECLWIA